MYRIISLYTMVSKKSFKARVVDVGVGVVDKVGLLTRWGCFFRLRLPQL